MSLSRSLVRATRDRSAMSVDALTAELTRVNNAIVRNTLNGKGVDALTVAAARISAQLSAAKGQHAAALSDALHTNFAAAQPVTSNKRRSAAVTMNRTPAGPLAKSPRVTTPRVSAETIAAIAATAPESAKLVAEVFGVESAPVKAESASKVLFALETMQANGKVKVTVHSTFLAAASQGRKSGAFFRVHSVRNVNGALVKIEK